MANYKKSRVEPSTLPAYIKYLRFGLGLPICSFNKGKLPVGYKRSNKKQGVILPDTRVLRALRQCYEAKDKGYEISIIRKWFERNTGKPLSDMTFYRLYNGRPIFKEIELPLHERRKLYRAALSEAQEEAQNIYEECTEEGTSGAGQSKAEGKRPSCEERAGSEEKEIEYYI